jgi:glutathione S-transferase
MRSLWPVGKFPVMRDTARNATVAEATVVIDYLDTHYLGATRFVPADADLAWQARLWDRFIDLYIHEQLQKIVGDNLRPAGAKDAYGVEQAIKRLQSSYAILDKMLAGKTWAIGDRYSLVDCAASPALFYARLAVPFEPAQSNLNVYYERLMRRPSYARALKEAEPYFDWVPLANKPQLPKE